jgi:hypothetical protein
MQDGYVYEQLCALLKPDTHTCTEACDVVAPRIEIHKKDGKEHIYWQFQKKQPWMDETTLVRRVENMYICKKTRSVHHCHADCSTPKITNSEHCLVCPISGLQWDNSTEDVKSWKLAAKCTRTLTVDKRDPNMFFRNNDGTLNNSSATLNVHTHQQEQEMHKLLDMLIFSNTRIRIELSKYVEGVRHATKELNKYKRYCTQKRIPKNIARMSTIYLHCKFRRPNFLRRIDKCKHTRTDVFNRVSNYVIRFHANVSKQLKVQSTFRIFACACIYLMKHGLFHDTWIIPKEPTFAFMLPEANVLSIFKIEKPLFTQSKNQILEFIRSLLPTHSGHEVLRILTA